MDDGPGKLVDTIKNKIEELTPIQDNRSAVTEKQDAAFTNQIFYSFLTAILEQLEHSFPDSDFLEHYKVFDRSLWLEDCGGTNDYQGQLDIEAFASDLPFTSKEDALEEWMVFKKVVLATTDKSLYSLMLTLLETSMASGYPNLHKLATVGLIVPVSTADCERGFSTLNRIKTEIRGSLTENKLELCGCCDPRGKRCQSLTLRKHVILVQK